ncbi:hypothetical protein Q6350_02580 [Isoptericola sp. b515]|uniref:hypothetical protein n=1 Tax=Isoptericola sp. b515 TaxID=3064652 RepID=UPI002712A5E4|nr:hypothetical protein [Isoptericola sp. b515]MDO8147308.1 hypothetical protein [Isoptericola sp. b515]
MRPLQIVVGGLVIVVLDLRFDGFDVVVDLIGWILVVKALRLLAVRDRAFAVAAVGAVLGGLGSIVQLVPGLTVGAGVVSVLGAVETLALTVVVVAICTGIARVLAHEPQVVRHARILRATDVALTVVALGLGSSPVLLSAGPTPGTTGWLVGAGAVVLLLGALTFVVLIWFLVFLWRLRDRPELQEQQPVVA